LKITAEPTDKEAKIKFSPNSTISLNEGETKTVIITVTGSNYVYGINMGRSSNTTVVGTKINVTSDYYADAIQLFDAYDSSIRGKVYSTATTEAYGVYSTAMSTGISEKINLTSLNINVKAEDPTAVLYEGSNDIILADSTYKIDGKNAIAIQGQKDWMGNVPSSLTAKNLYITLINNENSEVLLFNICNKISITNNTIKSQKGSRISFTNVTKTAVTDNYINIGKEFLGDDGVTFSQSKVIVRNNTPEAKQYAVITINKAEAKYRDNITISGKITNSEGKAFSNAEITIKFNGEEKLVKTTGSGKFIDSTFAATKTGTQEVSVTYAGNSRYKETTNTSTVTILKRESQITISDISSATVGKTFKVKGKLLSDDGLRLKNVKVNIKVSNSAGEHIEEVTTDKNGIYYINYTAAQAGEHTVVVDYAGNSKYEPCTATSKFTVTA
jgi:uncharacterized Zn-binding protein involved in type VI secretion